MSDDIKEIDKEIGKCLEDIDPRYYNPNFNLMTEIVNIFGDVNFDKVKIDIDNMNRIDEKLDKVIKLIVDKHSDEFFKILGFVRQMQKETENSKIKLTEARDILNYTKTIISHLSQGESNEWKLKSIYCSEIISKLNKTHQIFKIIHDSEVFVENNKLFDAIKLLKNSMTEIHEYDKEFRSFNLLVSIHTRFRKIEESIEEKLLNNLENILFFLAEDIPEKKINSMLNYFLNYYSKISIDNELTKPIQKMMFIIKNVVFNDLTNLTYSYRTSNVDKYFNENIVDLDSEKKLSSLYYIIKCLSAYDKSINVFTKMNEKLSDNLKKLVENTIKFLTEQLKYFDFSKFDLENSAEKLKFLLFFQIILVMLFHTLTKIFALNDFVNKNKKVTEICQEWIAIMEKAILMPLIVYQKLAGPRNEDNKENISDIFIGDNLVRMKINEVLTINLEFFPILYNIYAKYSSEVEKFYKYKFVLLNNYLSTYSKQLFDYYSTKIIPKMFFDLSHFIYEYDSDISNFKFISDTIHKINKLKYLLTFSFGNGYIEIMRIMNRLFKKLYEELKNFILQLRLKCSYNENFENLLSEFNKMKEYDEVIQRLEFKKYEKKLIEIQDVDKHSTKFLNLLSSFLYYCSRSLAENTVFISRNFKLIELLSKFISCMESLVIFAENFVFDLMKSCLKKTTMVALLEQINSINFVIFDTEAKDLETLLTIYFKTLEKVIQELSKLVLICKIEFSSIITNLIRNINKNEYWLTEPQMTPEHFTNAFINEFLMFNHLFQGNLNSSQYNFLIKDFILLINNSFINCLKTLNSNSINNFGINLLIRDFEFIKDKIGQELPEIVNTIYYFPNYVKILNSNEETLVEKLKEYKVIKNFEEMFIEPILTIRTNSRVTLNDSQKQNIIHDLFKN